MIPLAEAQRRVLAVVPSLPEIQVPLAEALGLALAVDVRAPHDVPPFPNSAMDGYAVQAADVENAPVVLRVLEDVPAGSVPTRPVESGAAIKIMTGAPMPAGADTVVKVEDTRPGRGTVEILVSAPEGTAVREAGGDLCRGEVVFERGVRLGPGHLGVLASIGVASPTVGRRPRVAVMSTGDEVRPPDTGTLEPGQIRDSNGPLLAGLLSELGAEVVDFGIVGDQESTLRSTLLQAARETDAVFTSGGVSMGEYDLVKQVLQSLGEIEFWRVAMQPAKPFAFGLIEGTPLFGLPGNPVSVVVAFEQFARPALLSMMGAVKLFRRRTVGVLGEPVSTDREKTVFLRVALAGEGDPYSVTSSGSQSSNVLSALARADALAVVPTGVGDLAIGDSVTLELFRSPETRTEKEVLGD